MQPENSARHKSFVSKLELVTTIENQIGLHLTSAGIAEMVPEDADN